ncbi:acyltransferase family protein [Alysiella filiformis]|uniref:Peptidoglycan/LPS O-acetylase OafA/YrhL, contains acyltransferase and SGNH-hydrolase domains n=1 Tax=Alysiella filiformis DSM 16848 TaxID=1120981 RepID=A0A286E5Q4_9NEIS|nr:acyltransferase [Alysiella filiformis]QMT30345.1 acyltransferase [Alysiella filiformis]UBQ56678.1 acyltransferase [Alysiella filiformis DSM 16848]SOD66232.1 Peptidoglycan/LPS O-acetylase OafA/YrhL, contains acyltransferase and SGNH-hydrolase domains [Alysiella filiformis DSM 16848]
MNHASSLFLMSAIGTAIAAFALQCLFRQPENAHAQRSTQLDGLRGILACAVVAHHFYYNFTWREGGVWGANSLFIINLGAVSVSLFFLMSGYLHFIKICHTPQMNWRAFYIARAKRIYPLYVAVWGVVLAITLWFKPVNFNNFGELMQFSYQWLLFQNVGFQGFQSHLIIAGVQWTLVYEWAVYAIMPLIHMIYHRKITFQPAAWLAIAVAWWIVLWHSEWRYYWLFVLALPALVFAKPIQAALKRFPIIIHVFMLILTAYIFTQTVAYSWEQRLLLAVWFAVVVQGYSFANLLNHWGLRQLGDLSYALYLTHGMVIFMWFGVWKMFEFKQQNFIGYLWHFPVILAVALVLAYVGNRFVAMPFVKK